MALDVNNMLLKVQPLNPIQLSPSANQNLDMERQRLELMRQEFEETKRKNLEEAEMQRQAEAGRMAREQLTNARELAQAQAVAQQKTMDERRVALGEMLKYRDSGDYEGMEAAAVRFRALGGQADRLGADANGLPTYQIGLDAAAAQKADAAQQAATAPAAGDESAVQSLNRMNALGYNMTGARDAMPETAPGAAQPLTDEQAFSAAKRARDFAEDVGHPAMSAAAPDYMGGVPSNVVDTGAMAAQALHRLGPALSSYQQAFAPAYRESVGNTNAAAAALGLPVDKAVELAEKLGKAPQETIKDDQQHQFELGKQAQEDQFKTEQQARSQSFAEAQQGRTLAAEAPLKAEQQRHSGDSYANESFKNQDIKSHVESMQSADTIIRLLNDPDTHNQEKAINYLMVMAKNKGHQSETDAERMTGLSTSSTADQVRNWLHQKIDGGYYDTIRKSMLKFAQDERAKDKNTVFSWMGSVLQSSDESDNELVGNGMRRFLQSNLPKNLRDEYDKENPPAPPPTPAPSAAPGAPAAPTGAPSPGTTASNNAGSFSDALAAAAARAGLDPQKLAPLLHAESGGDPAARNAMGSGARGIGQFIDSTAQKYTNPRTGQKFKNADEFATLSRDEQLPIVMQYFKDHGITKDSPAEDYALTLAAPSYIGKSRDTIIEQFRRGTRLGNLVRQQNPGWVPKDGSAINVDSILNFYGLRDTTAPPAAAGTNMAAASPGAGGADDAEGLKFIE